MGMIKEVIQQTKNRFVNMYELKSVNKKGNEFSYFLASRAKNQEGLKLSSRKTNADGVSIYAVVKGTSQAEDRIILVKQYRYTIDSVLYEMPAGLVEEGEDFHEAAVRELKEETGMNLHPIPVSNAIEKPFFTTVGMCDEACAAVYGYADGEVNYELLEDGEELEVVLVDRKEAARILKEEKVALLCAYQLMHFIHDEQVFGFLDSFPLGMDR